MLLGLGKTPVKSQTRKQLAKTIQKLQSVAAPTVAQTAKLAKAETRLTNLQAKHGTAQTGSGPVIPPPFPVAAPPSGYQWVYDAASNSYIPQPVTLSGGGGAGGGGGGGGGAAPDFTGYASEPYGTFTGASAEPTGTFQVPGAADAATSETTTLGTAAKLLIGAAAIGAAFLFFKKRHRKGA